MAAPPGAAAIAAWARHRGVARLDPEALRAELVAGGNLVAAVEARLAGGGREGRLRVAGGAAGHGEVCRRAAALGAGLRRRGLGPGAAVLIAGASSLELVLAYLATIRIGATAVFAEAGMTEAELRRLLGDAGPRLALLDDAAGRALAAIEAAPEAVALEGLAGLEAPGEAPPPEPAPGPAILAFTSGTTGRPKAVPLSHANLLASTRGVLFAWDWRPEDSLVHALPLSHQHGLSGVHVSLLSGSDLEVASRFDPEWLLDRARDPATSAIFAVPAMYEQLDGLAPAPVRLRLAVSGSAPLPPSLSERVAAWLGQPPLERYGSTEAGLVLSNPLREERLPGCVGFPLPGIEAVVASPQGEELPAGEEGELIVRGPQVFSGYRGAAAGEDFLPGGWFRSGDLARVESERGDVRIVGRRKEMILSGGLNVYPREVEAVLDAHPAVHEAVVVGLPSARWGERVVSVVRPAGELDAAALGEFCRERLSAYKCPKQFLVVEEIPKTRLGKVRREAVVELAAARAGEER
jgi:malonyl-CoA/methylmalonyl-CoA synthetase